MYATHTDHVGITFYGFVCARQTSRSKHETPIYYANGCMGEGIHLSLFDTSVFLLALRLQVRACTS